MRKCKNVLKKLVDTLVRTLILNIGFTVYVAKNFNCLFGNSEPRFKLGAISLRKVAKKNQVKLFRFTAPVRVECVFGVVFQEACGRFNFLVAC